MHIKKIIDQHRRDFRCIYECEHCLNTVVGKGYDDRNFHENVIPDMVCEDCNKKASSDYVQRATKYESSQIV